MAPSQSQSGGKKRQEPAVEKGFLTKTRGALYKDKTVDAKEEKSASTEQERKQTKEGEEAGEERRDPEKEAAWQKTMADRAQKQAERQEVERKEREARKLAYEKKKNDDGFGKGWSSRPKTKKSFQDWDNFDADAEMDRIEDEDRKSRGLNEVEIR